MVNTEVKSGVGGGDGRKGTLGELLYSGNARAGAPESDWVALVRSIADGDQGALHTLYERTYHLVFTLAFRITRDRQTAEELTLDVFYEVWRRAPRYDPAGGTVVGWIMNQARSRAIDRLRFEQRQKRMRPAAGDSSGDELAEAGGDGDLEVQEQARALRRGLTVLTAQERLVIETAYFQQLSYAEVAVRLNQPLGTVKTRIRSALRKLREVLSGRMGAP